MEKIIIGRTEAIHFVREEDKSVPAKIDTGADSSAVWASHIFVDDDNRLHFCLFAPGSPYYSGKEYIKKNFVVMHVRSSNGQSQIRYAVKLPILLSGRRVLATFTLADRSQNAYPVLVGCRLLKGKFLVDVQRGSQKIATRQVSEELSKLSKVNPKAFYDLHYKAQAQKGAKT